MQFAKETISCDMEPWKEEKLHLSAQVDLGTSHESLHVGDGPYKTAMVTMFTSKAIW